MTSSMVVNWEKSKTLWPLSNNASSNRLRSSIFPDAFTRLSFTTN